MKTPARLVALLATALLAVPALAACGGDRNADAIRSDGSVDLSKVTLVVGDQKGGSKALLQAAGSLDTPYRIDWKPFTSGPPLLDAVSAGAVDVGGVGNTPPLFAIDQHKKIKAISAYGQGGFGDAVVVPKGSAIRTVADLKGKKVALAKGSSANYSLLAQLKKAGLSFSDITPVWLQPTEALAAFKGGSVDAWTIWDPFTAQAEQDAGAREIANGEGLVNGLNFQVASDDALDDKATRAALKDFVARLASAQRWAGEHKSQWSAAWAKETGLPRSVTDAAIARKTFTPQPIDAEVVATEQEMWDAFAAQKQVSGHPRLADWFSTDFNSAVAAATSPRAASATGARS